MRTTSPDPVTDAAGYQRLLISLVGDDDPEVVQRSTPAALRTLVREAGDALRRRPAEGEWSVLELVGHFADAELVAAGRYRWALAHDHPPMPGYDQDLWVDRLHHNHDNPQETLALFEALRAANLALWLRTPTQERTRVAVHAERGPENVELMFQLLAGHDRFHLEQIRRTLAAVSTVREASPPLTR